MDLYAQIMEIKNYRDAYQMIAQRDMDGGDSANRIGVYYTCLAALNAPTDDMGMNVRVGFQITTSRLTKGLEYGRFRRHPDHTRWYYNENNTTRDQMAPLEAAMALNKDTKLARAHFWKRAKRLFFHFSTQNDGADAGPLKHKLPDPPTFSELGTLIRATRYKALYFLLPLTDLNLLIDVKFGRSLNERAIWDTDNQLLPQILAMLNQPTFLSETVRRAYAQTDAAARLRNYYRESNGMKLRKRVKTEATRAKIIETTTTLEKIRAIKKFWNITEPR